MPNTPSLDEQVEELRHHLNKADAENQFTHCNFVSRATLTALLEEREELKAELRSIDAVLARRPALANCTTRTESIELCIATAREVDGLRARSSLPSRSE